MRFKFNPLTFEQKLALRRSAEDSINAMNPLWGEFRKAATAPAIISLLDSLDEQAQELHKTKMALVDAGCVPVECKQRVETTEQRLQQPALTVSFYRDGIMAAAKWVDQQREAYDNEHGWNDPDTGTYEFGNSAQEEHSSTLQDIADGIRTLPPHAEQQPIKLPKGFSHQDGIPHALLGTGDVMISHIKWADAQGIAFAPMPAGKAGIGVNVDADVAGKSSDEIGSVFVVKATSVQSLEVLKEAVQMAIDGFKAEEAL